MPIWSTIDSNMSVCIVIQQIHLSQHDLQLKIIRVLFLPQFDRQCTSSSHPSFPLLLSLKPSLETLPHTETSLKLLTWKYSPKNSTCMLWTFTRDARSFLFPFASHNSITFHASSLRYSFAPRARMITRLRALLSLSRALAPPTRVSKAPSFS